MSCSLHAALAVVVGARERRQAVDAAPLVRPAAMPVVAELVEIAVAPEGGAERPAMVVPTTRTSVTRRATPAAAWAEIGARPGGGAAGLPHRRADSVAASRPLTLLSATSAPSVDAVGALDHPEGEIAARGPPAQPVALTGPSAAESDTSDEAVPVPASFAGGEPAGLGSDGDDRDGSGAGAGRGNGSGNDTADAWGKELRARILGDVRVELTPRDGRRVISHEEATALRVRDVFPRMPEALWPGWRPYLVTLEVCVDEEGRVGEVNLLSSAAPRLDQMVAAAARTWRYRPLVLAGAATGFCHAVVIKYESW